MPVSESDAVFVRDLVRRRSAIMLDASKDYLIETRLGQLAADRGLRGIPELVARARVDQSMQAPIIEAITTHETSFFRDFAPFEALQKDVLPRLLEARAASRQLTIWSAACSTGQEVYSIGILLREHFPQLDSWQVSLIATDISQQVLEKARAASFSQLEVNRGLPAALLLKHFERKGVHFVVRDAVRRLVTFRQVNLIDDASMTVRADVVFLRNVLIYFEVKTRRAILDRVRQLVASDGVLFLGSAETTLNVADGWEQVGSGRTVYYKVRR